MPGGGSPLTMRARLVNIRYFPNPLGIVPLCGTLFHAGGGSPLTMRYKLRQSHHTISPLDQSLASALRMEFHTFPNAIFELLTAAQRPGGGGSPLTMRARLVNIRYFPNPLGIVPLCGTLFHAGGGSPLTMRYKLRQSHHTISPLDQSLASALRMEFHTFPNAIFELLTAAQRPGGVLRGGRLEIGAGRNDPNRSGIDFAVSASPEPVLWVLSYRHKKVPPPAGMQSQSPAAQTVNHDGWYRLPCSCPHGIRNRPLQKQNPRSCDRG